MGLFKTAAIGYVGYKTAKEGTNMSINLVFLLLAFIFSFVLIPLFVYVGAQALEENAVFYAKRIGNRIAKIKTYALLTMLVSGLLCFAFIAYGSKLPMFFHNLFGGNGHSVFWMPYLFICFGITSWVYFYYRMQCADIFELNKVFDDAHLRINPFVENDKQEILAMKKNKYSNEAIYSKIEEKTDAIVKNFSDYVSINRLLTDEEKSEVGNILKPLMLKELDVEYKESIFSKMFS